MLLGLHIFTFTEQQNMLTPAREDFVFLSHLIFTADFYHLYLSDEQMQGLYGTSEAKSLARGSQSLPPHKGRFMDPCFTFEEGMEEEVDFIEPRN